MNIYYSIYFKYTYQVDYSEKIEQTTNTNWQENVYLETFVCHLWYIFTSLHPFKS